jgi:murein DD-endopeptidase MepM/ murein hydrolase activator NlpD
MINKSNIYNFVFRVFKIVEKHRKHITYVSLISLIQVSLVLWYLNFKKPSDSLSNIEKGITELSQGQKELKTDIGTIKIQLVTMVKKDSAMDNQLRHYPSTLPLAMSDITRASSLYSERIDPITGKKNFHWGIDYPAKKNTPVYATASGIIEKAEMDGEFGNMIRIDHLNKYESIYAHLTAINVKPKQEINRGDLIGTVGNTGKSTGYHLHYEVIYTDSITKIARPINPNIFRSPLQNISSSNNISGLFDYRKFMSSANYF